MAIDPRTSRFWQETLRSGLIGEEGLAACWEAIPEAKRDAESIDRRMARQAIAAELLTLWQAQQVLAGRAATLKVGKYVVLDLIGKGGMGLVFLARDTRLRRPVAIKVLSRERASNSRALARFEREAKVGAQLQHDNLVRIYDEGEFRGLRYLVMEYIEGRNVAQLLAESGRLPPCLAASIARQVALGLEHARHKGLIHRDVNPQNILLTRDGTAKLTDLGLAIDLGDPDDVVTRDGATVGTFDYISPEQARHPRSVDTRSDLYSLGCTLYHMLAGRVPFPATSLPEKLYAHQIHQPDPVSKSAPEVPEGLAAIVRRMMAKAPGERFPTPRLVADALEPFAEGSRSIALALGPAAREAGESGGPAGASDPRGYHLGPALESQEPPPTRTASTMKPDPRSSSGLTEPPRTDPEPGRSAEADGRAARGTEPEPEPPVTRESPANGLGLPIDLGPEPSLVEAISASRSRSRSTASRSGSASGSSDKAPDDPGGRADRPAGPGRLPAAVAAAGLIVAVAAVALFRTWGGDGGADPGAGPGGGDRRAPADVPAAPAPGASDFAVRRPGGELIATDDLQRALDLAPNNGGTVYLGPAVEPIRIGPVALLAPRSPIVIRPRPGARTTLSVTLDGEQPWLRQLGGELTLEDLTVLVHYGGGRNQERPPLIEASGNLTLRRCTFAVRSGSGPGSRAVQSVGTGTKVVGCLFRGFDRPLDLVAYGGMSHELSQCQFIWPRGMAGAASGWAVRIAVKPSGQDGPARLTIDRCTALRAAGLVESTSLADDPMLEVRVSGSGIRADHLVCWAPPAEDAAFPGGLRWTGAGNRYDLGGPWVVSSSDGLASPEGAPSDLESWVEAIGGAGEKDSMQIAVDVPDRSALDSATLDPVRYAAFSEDEPIGADPAAVGPPD